MRIIVTGSRQLLDQNLVYEALDAEFRAWIESGEAMAGDSFTVIHGAAPGADAFAAQWVWDRRNLSIVPIQEPYPADWRRGQYAGNQRNYEMVQLGADVVLGFFQPGAGNTGTRNCIETAERWLAHKGTKIKEIWADA